MTTRINEDGSLVREIYAKADSAFLAGDMTHNPYMFNIDSGWRIEPVKTMNTDSVSAYQKDYYVKISKNFLSVKDLPTGLQFDEILRPVVVPDESLQKHFRWFYTYYSFKGIYANISGKIPVSIDRFMNEAERRMWFQGDFSTFAGMNGFEMKEEMDEIEKKFWTWYSYNMYEAYYDAIVCFDKQSGNSPYLSKLNEIKENIFQIYINKGTSIENLDIELSDIAKILDRHLNTGYYSELCRKNEKAILEVCGEKVKYIENLINTLFDKHIEYELIIPGKIIHTNAPLSKQDTLVWKVDAMRLVADDYTIVAESRIVHIWAFIVTTFFVILAVYCFVRLGRLKK
jgi:hypothetical protein